ncbi:MAG: ArsB/NhaD family transporter [Candidatus Cloacimonetes bacterium]|nr:ArsB/NhaD family transporter [Candidatus Cloacimonadota bacterium]
MTIMMLITLFVFVMTYIFIIMEWMNKMLAAMIGGFLIVLTGIIHQQDALMAVDWNVIFFLIGMMLVISVLKKTGVFMYIAIRTAKIARGKPIVIMTLMFVITAVLSAFLGSVTTVMILVPIVLLICGELKITPIPFIITMAIASNMGGTATMVGDPPNIMIGSATDYTFMDFLFNLTPPVVIITSVSVAMIWLMYRNKMKVSMQNRARLLSYREDTLITDKKLLLRSSIVLLLMLIALILQSVLKIETATIAMTAGLSLLLMSNRNQVENVLINDVDWVTIFFFIGLFMIVESLVVTGFIDIMAKGIIDASGGRPKTASMLILWLSGALSAIIDNVPFVAAMIPMVQKMSTYINNPTAMHPIWWSLSLGTCLGGNGTLVGASANIVAVGIASRNGFRISFRQFTQIGIIFTFNSLLISSVYLLVRYF